MFSSEVKKNIDKEKLWLKQNRERVYQRHYLGLSDSLWRTQMSEKTRRVLFLFGMVNFVALKRKW
jgi:hypothetical protein